MSEERNSDKLVKTIKELRETSRLLIQKDLKLSKAREQMEESLKKLKENNGDLERANKFMIDRELKMVSLKKENERLKERIKKMEEEN